MTAVLAPDNDPDVRRSRVAERHWRPWVSVCCAAQRPALHLCLAVRTGAHFLLVRLQSASRQGLREPRRNLGHLRYPRLYSAGFQVARQAVNCGPRYTVTRSANRIVKGPSPERAATTRLRPPKSLSRQGQQETASGGLRTLCWHPARSTLSSRPRTLMHSTRRARKRPVPRLRRLAESGAGTCRTPFDTNCKFSIINCNFALTFASKPPFC